MSYSLIVAPAVNIAITPAALYPFGMISAVEDVACYLPMPWKSHGNDFFTATDIKLIYSVYILIYGIFETVEINFCVLILFSVLYLIK